MTGIKSNRELYQEYTAMAPKLLAKISRMLILCRNTGVPIPKGIRNIFEFTWEELINDTTLPVASTVLGLEISIGPPPLIITEVQTPVQTPTRKKTLHAASLPRMLLPASAPTKLAISHHHSGPPSPDTLHQFQRHSVHLLAELLSLKMKAMLESMSGKSLFVCMPIYVHNGACQYVCIFVHL